VPGRRAPPTRVGTAEFKCDCADYSGVAVSFDLFGTLVSVTRPADPAAAVARELRERGVPVPTDWTEVYGTQHVDAQSGAEVPLPAHVDAALASRGVDADSGTVRRAVVTAFDPAVTTREGAAVAVAAAADRGPVGLLSNCSVPGLAGRALDHADLPRDAFDAVVTSAACGWRKPDVRAFGAVADALGVDRGDLVHVGDDGDTDGGVVDAGGRFVPVGEVPLSTLPVHLEGSA